MARSSMTESEIEDLLDDACRAWPESNFVASVREWYEENGFITEGQAEVLEDIRNRE